LTIGFDGGEIIENEFAVEHEWFEKWKKVIY